MITAKHLPVPVAKSPWHQLIGRRWRPICGFAEPYAPVSGSDPGNPSGNIGRSRPGPRKSVRRCGPAGSGRLQLALWAGVHLRLRRLPPVCAVAEPSERAQRRMPESTPVRSLLNVKAATLLQASKSPVQTAPAGRPARPRLRSYGTKRTPALKGSTMTPIAPASDLAVNALTAMLAAASIAEIGRAHV